MKRPVRCHKCIRKSAYKLVDKWYCPKCFAGLVEQKIRQNLRRYGLKKDKKLLVNDKASKYVVEKVINIPVTVVSGKRKADYLVLPWTMDDENEDFLQMLFKDRFVFGKENMKLIKLFYPVSKKDMKKYFTIKKIKYMPEKTELNELMDGLELKYPGTKSALLKSEERLRRILG